MSTIQQAVEAVQDIVGAVSGIRKASDEPPDQISAWPFAICYPTSAELDRSAFGAGYNFNHVTLALEIHHQITDLPRAYNTMVGFIDSVTDALWDNPTLSGAVTTIDTIKLVHFGPLGWGGIETMGPRFEIALHQWSST